MKDKNNRRWTLNEKRSVELGTKRIERGLIPVVLKKKKKNAKETHQASYLFHSKLFSESTKKWKVIKSDHKTWITILLGSSQ